MSYGLQLSASGVASAMYRQDVLSNNLANANTVGFKADVVSSKPRLDVRHEDGVMNLPSNELLERLGGGVLMNPNRVNLSQGPVTRRTDPLCVAIESEGFFRVSNGDSSKMTTLTRDGRFAVNTQQQLVMATSGMPVLDDGNQPIIIDQTQTLEISGDGSIRQGGAITAVLGMVSVKDTSQMTKYGDSLLKVPTVATATLPAEERKIRQNAVEESSVNELRTLLDMTSASREIDAHVALMQSHDKMMERAINGLGRVS
ncbi:MAG: flagellar hook-basal body complex protein [Planctomycetota bacterium]|nr:flagellar hook-basal body complex protein [Planctomycetota bacterium]